MAVKIVEKKLQDPSKDAVNIYKKEIILQKKLEDNPYILDIYEYFEDEERIYSIMQYCKGGDLLTDINKRIHNHERYTEKQIQYIMFQLVKGVNYLAQNKVIHRDIKPENVLFVNGPPGRGNGLLKITDFGTAVRLRNPDERLSDFYGTTHYMAPEKVGKNYSFSSDIWSVGVIYYLMLHKRLPYEG